MLYMLLAGSDMSAARWGNKSAKGNEYAGHYAMEDQDLPDGQLSYVFHIAPYRAMGQKSTLCT